MIINGVGYASLPLPQVMVATYRAPSSSEVKEKSKRDTGEVWNFFPWYPRVWSILGGGCLGIAESEKQA